MNIVTHRFRGFSNRENSLDGFRNALEAGVKFYEFDLRLTKDGVPVLNHDRFLVNSTGEQYDIVTSFFHEVMKFSERSFEKATVNKVHNHAESETEKLTSAPKKNEPEKLTSAPKKNEPEKITVNFQKGEIRKLTEDSSKSETETNLVVTLQEVLDLFVEKKRDESKIFVDIKDFGGEKTILKELKDRNLLPHTVIVSWLPEVLFEINRLEPTLPLCFSHNYIGSAVVYQITKFFLKERNIFRKTRSLAEFLSMAKSQNLKNINFNFNDYNSKEFSQSENRKRTCSIKRDFEHTLAAPPTGRLMEVINDTNGFLCTQYKSLNNRYANLLKQPTGIIPYSINKQKDLLTLPKNLDYPFILSDNPELVSKY